MKGDALRRRVEGKTRAVLEEIERSRRRPGLGHARYRIEFRSWGLLTRKSAEGSGKRHRST